MRQFTTARTYPLDSDGRFQSATAEFVHEEAAQFGLTRDQTRHLLQAFHHANDESNRRYEESNRRYEATQGICVRCGQKLAT